MSQTSTIPTSSQPDGTPESRSLICRDGLTGLLIRSLIVTLAMIVPAVLLMLARTNEIAFASAPQSVLLGIAFVVWFSMILGLVFSEYPRGDQLALARIGLATFCRTGLPLLVVLVVVNYATRLENSVAIFIGILYAIGLISSLVLELSRLGFPLMSKQA